jgi:hypothetical protein
VPYQIKDMTESETDKILNEAGASKRLDCKGGWVDNRDSIDERIVNELTLRLSSPLPQTQSDVGGYVSVAPGDVCIDTDNDGLPDAYENSHNLNAVLDDAFMIDDSNGLTNMENYLRGL